MVTDWGVAGPTDALVETEDDELPLVKPERRGGGGGGAFAVMEDGDEDRRGATFTGPSSEIGAERSEAANGFDLRLCLRARGGGGALRFCGGAASAFTPCLSAVSPASGTKGREGSGLSTLIGDLGDVGLGTSDDAVVLDVVNESAGSSKDTICGPFGFTSFPWRGLGAGGLGLPDPGVGVPTSCCRSSSIGDPSYEVLGDSCEGPATGSKIDCRDIEDASVLLFESPMLGRLWKLTGGAAGAFAVGLLFAPVNKSLLKSSTS